jgi:hypothetical protein
VKRLGWIAFWAIMLFNFSNIAIYIHSPLEAGARRALFCLVIGCFIADCLIGGILLAKRLKRER